MTQNIHVTKTPVCQQQADSNVRPRFDRRELNSPVPLEAFDREHMTIRTGKSGQYRVSRKALEQAVLATGGSARAKVPSFAREWRTRQDSNLWPLPSEGNALSS